MLPHVGLVLLLTYKAPYVSLLYVYAEAYMASYKCGQLYIFFFLFFLVDSAQTSMDWDSSARVRNVSRRQVVLQECGWSNSNTFRRNNNLIKLAYERFPDTLDVSRTHLVRQSSFWKRAFIVTSANDISSLIQHCEHSVFTDNFNTLSEITAAWFWLCSMVT